MTETSQVWDGIIVGDASVAPYSASEWAARQKLLQGLGVQFPNYGVLHGSGDGTYPALCVQAKSPASANVEIQIGSAVVAGYLYQNTAALTMPISSNASGNARIDTVILRVDFVAQTIRAVVKQGTPAASPARPSLQQDATYWEVPLADVAVANGFATLAQSTISQRQRYTNTHTFGWQSKAFQQDYVVSISTGQTVSLTVAQTILIPIALTGNMNLGQLDVVLSPGVGVQNTFGWDLYVEDVNDSNTAEKTIRRVAQSAADVTTVGNVTGTSTVMGGSVALAPGLYWLAIQNRHGANNLVIASYTTGLLDINRSYTKTTTNPNGQTLDAVTGWATNQNALHVCLRGYVFGTVLGS